MKIFIELIGHGIWDAIVNGPSVSKIVVDGKTIEKP